MGLLRLALFTQQGDCVGASIYYSLNNFHVYFSIFLNYRKVNFR